MTQLLLIINLLGQVSFLPLVISDFIQLFGLVIGIFSDLVNFACPSISEDNYFSFLTYSSALAGLNSNSRVNAPIYLYNRDKSVLYFISNKYNYVEQLGINNFTLEQKIKKGLFYLGKYSITMTPPTTDVKLNIMTLEEIKAMLDQDRSKNKSTIGKKGMPILHPYFITGFTDGDGCFMVPITKNNSKLGWTVCARFSLCLHKKDKGLLEAIQFQFNGVGNIHEGVDNLIQYNVSSIGDIINIIIPHFDKYPLLTQKRLDFEKFKQIAELIHKKEHLKEEGFTKVLSLNPPLNKDLSISLKKAFPSITPTEVILSPITEILDPHWLAGFAEAESCFYIKIWNSSTTKTGQQISFQFQLTQHSRDKLLMEKLVNYLDCGKVEKVRKDQCCNFITTNFSEISEKIIPFFSKYELKGSKAFNFNLFKEGVMLAKRKEHLTNVGLEFLKEIKAKMNK